MAVTLGLCFTLFAMMITKSLRSKVTTGREGLMGLEVEVTEDFRPEGMGMVRCRGEVWKARVSGGMGTLRRGDTAVVTGIDGIKLVVRGKPAPQTR
jgi:membrane-bound ClpP family serine protease